MKVANVILFLIELLALFAGIALVVIWFNDPKGNYEPLVVLATFVFIGSELIRRFWPKIILSRKRINSNDLAEFILEGENIKGRLMEIPLPVKEHNEWVEKMNSYFDENDAKPYKVRLSNFSGLVFYVLC